MTSFWVGPPSEVYGIFFLECRPGWVWKTSVDRPTGATVPDAPRYFDALPQCQFTGTCSS